MVNNTYEGKNGNKKTPGKNFIMTNLGTFREAKSLLNRDKLYESTRVELKLWNGGIS